MTVIGEMLGMATAATAAATTTAAAAGTTSAALLAAPAGLGAAAGFSATTTGLTAAGVFSALQTGFSLASASSSLFGNLDAELAEIQAKQTAESLELESEESRLLGDAERIRGLQESGDILAETNKVLQAQAVSFAANGLDVSFGTTVTTRESSARNADIQNSLSREDAQIRSLSRRRQARELLLKRDAVLNASGYATSANNKRNTTSAAYSLYDLGLRRLNRG